AGPIGGHGGPRPGGPWSERPPGRPDDAPSPAGTVSPGIPALLPGSVLRMNSRNVGRLLASGPWTAATAGVVGPISASMPYRWNVSVKTLSRAGRASLIAFV